MTKVRADIWIWAALTLIVPASCCDREDSMQATVTLYPSISNNVETEIHTRASITVSGTAQGTTYEDDPVAYGLPDLTTILAYAVPTESGELHQIAANRKHGLFRYSNGRWRSHVTAVDGHNYNLYAISPNTLVANPESDFNWGLSTLNDNTSFSTDNVALTLHGLDVIVNYDPLISIAAAGRHVYIDNNVEYEVVTEAEGNQPQETAPLTRPALTKNNYDIGKVIQPGDNDTQNQYRVWMAMDHLYAKATIYFAVYQDYYDIRDIRLKEAKIVVGKDKRSLTGNHTYNFATSALSLDANPAFGANNNDNTDIEIDLIRGTTANNNRDTGQEYVTLTPPGNNNAGYKDFAWFCFLPQSLLPYDQTTQEYTLTCPPCTLKVEYDVVDKDGNMVRENQTAQNIIHLDKFYRDDYVYRTPQPGDHFKIKVMVKPSYLYVLTDDDAKMELLIQKD